MFHHLGNMNGHTLDNFGHGGAYGVTSHTTAMDIFTVDSVGSRRQYAPSVPPPYTTTIGNGRSNGQTNWAANSNRKNSASAAVNGVLAGSSRRASSDAAAAASGGAAAAVAASPKIYDPNEGDEGDEEWREQQ